VKIFNFQDFDKNATAINEDYIYEIHNNIGKKIGNRFYIVAPEMNIDVIGDYIQFDDIKYYLLKIPYQAIKELHAMEFKKAEQPKNSSNVNSLENSVGFYFNETPDVEREIKLENDGLKISIKSVKPQYASLQNDEDVLAMVLFDSSGNEDFIMQEAFFADDIRVDNSKSFEIIINKSLLKSKTISLIYVDIFGNEFKERISI